MQSSLSRKQHGNVVTYYTQIQYIVKVDWIKVLQAEGACVRSATLRSHGCGKWLQATFDNTVDMRRVIEGSRLKSRAFQGLDYIFGAPLEALYATKVTSKWNTRDRHSAMKVTKVPFDLSKIIRK
jgi:hypothetical protein